MSLPSYYWDGVFTVKARLMVAWRALRGRPVMYRLRTSPFAVVGDPEVLIMECHIDGSIKPHEGAGLTLLGNPDDGWPQPKHEGIEEIEFEVER